MDTLFVRYINLDRRQDRNVDTMKKLVDVLGFDISNIKRFSAIDGSNIVEDLRNKNYLGDDIIKILQSANMNVRNGELGCLLSHYFLLKEIVNDTSIPDNSNLWDMIYFGGRFKHNFSPSNLNMTKFFSHSFDNFYLRIQGQGMDWDRATHNYLVKKNNISKILNSILEYYLNETKTKITIQVDHMYCCLSKKLNMYDYFPHLFFSPMNYSSDIQHSRTTINTLKLE